ncbi:hypothetical protein LY76DRAFT_678021 [Colletotrichum caudatum]|nr:hypothetical protein LY76DRAFT_678021 [Colletotrichum caudatum]
MIYPVFPKEGLTEYTLQPATDNRAVYLKASRLFDYQDNSDDKALCLLKETRFHEKIRCNPHRNLVSYLGCVVEGGRFVRLAMKRYRKSLYDCLRPETREDFTSQQRIDSMDHIEAAAKHLH